MEEVPRGVGLVGPGSIEEMLTGALRHDHQGVFASRQPMFEGGEETVLSFELEGYFWDQDEIGVLAGERRAGRNKAGVAAHQLHQADPVRRAPGFDVRPAKHLSALLRAPCSSRTT